MWRRGLVTLLSMTSVGLGIAIGIFALRRPAQEQRPQAQPKPLLGVYLPNWGTVTLGDLPADYNLIYAAFALGDGNGGGAVIYTPEPAQSPDALAADIASAHRAGRTVLLAIGGADSRAIHITTPSQVDAFVASVSRIIDRYDFDGIDWDLENLRLWNARSVTDASRRLLARYGDEFLISTVPGPGPVEWKRWARQMGDDLDLFGMQFYEYPATARQRIADIERRIDEMVTVYGIDPTKLMIGAMNASGSCPTCTSRPSVYRDAIVRARATHPTLRGAFVWSAAIDREADWVFARQVGPTVLSVP
jgi:hypothetical protein